MTEGATLRADARANRARIVAAAADLFAEQGLDVSFNAIAQRAGVGNATLYRHFDGLEALREAVLLSRLGQVAGMLEDLGGRDDPFDGLRRLLAWALETASFAFLKPGGPVCAPIEEARVRIRAALDELLEQGRARGCLRAGIDRDDIVVAALMLAELARNPEIPRERKLTFLDTLLCGLRGDH